MGQVDDRNAGGTAATAKRWLDVVAMVFVGMVMSTLFAPLQEKGVGWLSTVLANLSLLSQTSIILALSALVWFVVIRLGGLRLVDCVNGSLLHYPPAWLGGALGAAVLALWPRIAAYGLPGILRACRLHEYLFAAVITFPGALLLAVLCNWIAMTQIRRIAKEPNSIEVSSLSEDEASLRDPIDHPAHDLLGHAPIAKRLSDLLANDKSRTIGLVGPYGSGKTSVLNMVEYYLKGKDATHCGTTWRLKDRWHICRVEAWGRNPNLFAEQLLRCAVQTLGKSADVLSIVAMPSHYTAAMSGSGSVWATVLSALLMAGSDPVDCLFRLVAKDFKAIDVVCHACLWPLW